MSENPTYYHLFSTLLETFNLKNGKNNFSIAKVIMGGIKTSLWGMILSSIKQIFKVLAIFFPTFPNFCHYLTFCKIQYVIFGAIQGPVAVLLTRTTLTPQVHFVKKTEICCMKSTFYKRFIMTKVRK